MPDAAAPPRQEGSVLGRIVAETRDDLARRRAARPEPVLRGLAAARPAPRDFVAALRCPGLGLVAEVKKGSPSKGPFARDLDHVAAARAFRDGGAAAVSVLTAPAFFAGDAELADVAAALAADAAPCPPLLRKEFIVDPYQVLESRALGADAFLVIVKTVPDAPAIRELIEAGSRLGMAAFAEVTDEAELDLALRAGLAEAGGAIGINNRDLHTFEEDLGTTERLRPLVPAGIPLVAASGVRTPADLARMRACGVDAVLIGEGLTRGGDIAGAIGRLFPGGAGGAA
ncbi:MAG: indole-3-glycerol phosphate synthase TrpC [Chloroflexi bacterium]|nr:indole-3-glycerol phosphate synthase TrpC [Chloroflexota bacterium]